MTAPKHRWFRWSLRTMFVVVTLAAILLASARRNDENWSLRRQQAADRARIEAVFAKLTRAGLSSA